MVIDSPKPSIMTTDIKFQLMVNYKMEYWHKIEDYKNLLHAMSHAFVGNYQDQLQQALNIATSSSPKGDQHLFFEVAKRDLINSIKHTQAA